MPHHDEIAQKLEKLNIPEPSSNATYRILEAARQEKRRKVSWFNPLRRLRASILVPQISFAIMASVLGVFILIGMAGRTMKDVAPAQVTQKVAPEMAKMTPENIPNDLLLYDLDFYGDEVFEGLQNS